MAAAAATTTAKSWLVTGANKGIGLAICRGLLAADQHVYLGSRDIGRGNAAAESLGAEVADRVKVVQLDVTDDASVAAAVETVRADLGEGGTLGGLVNNAGWADSFGFSNLENHHAVIDLNLHGVIRTTSAFLPLMPSEGGRIVMISSGAASMYIAKCAEARLGMWVNDEITMEELMALVDEVNGLAATVDDEHPASDVFGAAGLSEGTYGFSKAALNLYTMIVARENPGLCVNSCSPGFIETDLTRPFADASGKAPAEMGMKPVDEGAVCPLYLALGDVPTPSGSGWYYGSDAKRSPLHKYRDPGEPPFDGDISDCPTSSAQTFADKGYSDKEVAGKPQPK